MCGLVAIITSKKSGFSTADLEAFETMLFLDTFRGDDSTGVFLVEMDGSVHLAKAAIDGPSFLKTPEWKEIRHKAYMSGAALVGHNRKATRGSVIDENAHPFVVDDRIVLVHNGSFTGGHKHIADVEVDSHALAHVLANEPDIEKAFNSVDTAFACIWYDVPNTKLHIMRNEQRPLHHAFAGDTWFFTSDQDILEFSLNRNKIKSGVWSLLTNNLQTWDFSSKKITCSAKEIKLTKKVYTTRYFPVVADPVQTENTANEMPIPVFNHLGSVLSSPLKFEQQRSYGAFKTLKKIIKGMEGHLQCFFHDIELGPNNDDNIAICTYTTQADTTIRVVFPVTDDQLPYFMTEGNIECHVKIKDVEFMSYSAPNTEFSMGYMVAWGVEHTVVIGGENEETCNFVA